MILSLVGDHRVAAGLAPLFHVGSGVGACALVVRVSRLEVARSPEALFHSAVHGLTLEPGQSGRHGNEVAAPVVVCRGLAIEV